MSALRQDHIAVTAEARVANILRALESDDSPAAECARWLANNWLRARKGLFEIASATPALEIQRLVVEALEVIEDV